MYRLFSFVGAPRIELGLNAPKALVLPLHHAPKLNCLKQSYNTIIVIKSQSPATAVNFIVIFKKTIT